ncbi:C6 finger domain [Mycena venus]|uniref:C6 finger domain n=1 Tax=Mycena venus TaxID=2733690 RepID=A0A8H6X267_9AGAR|nr:C6 finger domain [Mycena venus]
MPSAPLSVKKTKATLTAEGDHRKRRRNRTTQSCLNCHATKRMCNRARPCSRCSQLGLSGNCVYEVDDPSRQGKLDEEARLMNRIAELEGVIRELKNKPHPRWLADKDRALSSDGSHTSSPSSEGPSTPHLPAWTFPSSSRSSSPSFPFPSPSSGQSSLPSYEKDSVESLLSMYTGLSEHMHIRRDSTCRCLTEPACYSAVLELSARLRRVAEILARSPSHVNNSTCGLNTRISALDVLVKDSLLGLRDHSLRSGLGCRNPIISPSVFNQFYANNDVPPISWDMDDIPRYNDDMMSWVPNRGYML